MALVSESLNMSRGIMAVQSLVTAVNGREPIALTSFQRPPSPGYEAHSFGGSVFLSVPVPELQALL